MFIRRHRINNNIIAAEDVYQNAQRVLFLRKQESSYVEVLVNILIGLLRVHPE